ncbi:SHOCT domain-containing protein [Flavobacterium anhuiense]|nr:SHOCT domain-containing protein [Flavobacterium anhuiense]URM39178.1 SHOCT domain-containing protein [Flavobacterium anhuiense]
MGILLNQLQQNKETPKQETGDDLTSKLQKLKSLFDAGLIDEDEFKTKKSELLSQL